MSKTPFRYSTAKTSPEVSLYEIDRHMAIEGRLTNTYLVTDGWFRYSFNKLLKYRYPQHNKSARALFRHAVKIGWDKRVAWDCIIRQLEYGRAPHEWWDMIDGRECPIIPTKDFPAAVRWVADHLRVTDLDPKDAPSAAAFAMWEWAKDDKARFFTTFGMEMNKSDKQDTEGTKERDRMFEQDRRDFSVLRKRALQDDENAG